MNTAQTEIKALNITRFIAALCVVIYHYGKSAAPFNAGVLNVAIQNGGFAVSYFFALSGFIMTYAYNKPGIAIDKKSFYRARFARIYPLYFIAFIAVLFAMYLFNDSKPKGLSVILQAFCLQAWKPGISMEINYVGWSIAVEAFFYLLFPFLLQFFQSKRTLKVMAIALLFWMGSLALHSYFINNLAASDRYNVGQFISFFPPWHINSFVLGMAASFLYTRVLKGHKFASYFAQITLLTGIILVYVFFVLQPVPMGYLTNGGIIPVFLLVILGLAMHKGLLVKLLSLKVFKWLGDISYGVYLWQFFVLLLVQNLLFNGANEFTTAQFWIYVGILILLSALSYQFYEKPLRTLLRFKRK